MQIEVVNVKNYGKVNMFTNRNELYIFAGRPSPLSNPFPLTNERFREEVIDKFRKSPPLKEIKKLIKFCKSHSIASLKLGCYCSPRTCHCDVIKDIIEKSL